MSDTASSTPPSAASRDVGTRAQEAAEAHLGAIWEAEDAADDGLDVDHPAVGPFDGCDTCVIRETLHAAWPVIEQDVIDKLTAAGFTDAAALVAADRYRP